MIECLTRAFRSVRRGRKRVVIRGPKFKQGDEPTEGSRESQNGLKPDDFEAILVSQRPVPLTGLGGCSYLSQLVSKRL